MATTSAPPQQPPTRRGPGEPRHLILPSGIVSSGWPACRDTSAQLGIHYDPWQQELNRALLAKDAQGLYAADTVVISICRQSGKTYNVGGVVFADSIIHPGTTTVWTAHRFKVSRESFNEMRAWARRPELAPHLDYDDITTAAGNECIPFRNGSRIVFAARERGAVRGFTKVRRLVLDEAQILTEAAMSDLVPTTNQAENPQIILMGTPPKPSDPGEVFSSLRATALSGDSDGVLYVEFSADPGCDLDDWDAVADANPSFPLRTPKRAVLRLRKLLTSDDDYAREGLGKWSGAGTSSVIGSDTWALRADESSIPKDRFALAVDVAPDRSVASVALAGQRADGSWHVELDEHRKGVGWLPAYVADRCARNDIRAVVIDQTSPQARLIDELRDRKVKVTTIGYREVSSACGTFYDGAMEGWLHHIDQPQLNLALSVARKRACGDAGWAWNRKSAASDITPLVACTLALWGAQSSTVKTPLRRAGSGKVVVS